MIITIGNTGEITENFNENEFYSTSPDAPNHHLLADNVIYGLQAIRTHYGLPIRVTSTYRTSTHSIAIGSNPITSQHRKGTAIDFEFIGDDDGSVYQQYIDDILNEGDLFQELNGVWQVNGFGIYDNFFHIDTRLNELEGGDIYAHSTSNNGSYSKWDSRKKKSLLSFLDNFGGEDGFSDYPIWFRVLVLLIFSGFSGFLTISFYKFIKRI